MNQVNKQSDKRPLMVTHQESIDLADVMNAVKRARGSNGIDVRYMRSGLSIALRSARPGGASGVAGVDYLPVKLTGRTSPNGYYTWTEQQWNKTSQVFEDKPSGNTSASEGFSQARDIALRRTVPLNSIQYIAPDPFMVTSSDAPVYVFHPVQAWILMRITGNSGSGAQWLYTAAEVTLSESTVASVTGGLSLTSTLRNLAEALNTDTISGTSAWYVGGVQANPAFAGAVYPTGFAPRPVGGGGTSNTHRRDQLVRVEESIMHPGTFMFSHPISHDGGCS
jgi:hypothetical protein